MEEDDHPEGEEEPPEDEEDPRLGEPGIGLLFLE
jgi:hypothetical protein